MAAFEKKSGKKFKSVEIPGSGKGIDALMAGKVELAGASRPLKAEEKKAGLAAATIGYDAIAVFVHKSNPVKNLTKEQLKDQLGDPNLTIIDVRMGRDWNGSEYKIQGAVRENPTDVNSWKGKYRKDQKIVLYCA